ncbi:cytochrome P450 [Microbacterium sp. KUDC0406]|uniref:cytochrome P450 n=1 Tax=Microbacterium sp. KUDC0406 TaxID=2909588 RepID=UPI001F161081|nr:cytochrome P450 [Microbacterium sp. KUDC0406]UJP10132.1 cytochrome P450 [Microbacterium sp. KUDC0406]
MPDAGCRMPDAGCRMPDGAPWSRTHVARILTGRTLARRRLRGDSGGMSGAIRLGRHADVVAAATDPTRFSSRTSTHLHVPNGMDGAEHAAFRAVIDRYLTPQAVAELEPMLAGVARDAAQELERGTPVEIVGEFGEVFAVRAQCRWLGWPDAVEDELRMWMEENYAAARHPDPERNASVAAAFDDIVRHELHRAGPGTVTARLAAERVGVRPLTEPEIISILRNWTAGDLGSLARCVGVVVRRLADRPALQQRMRVIGDDRDRRAEFDAILDECLRIEDPFVTNRRITTCPVTTLGGQDIPQGTAVLLDWGAANLDPAVFSEDFDPVAHADDNLVFGIGPHVCPGRDLSLAELHAAIVELLRVTTSIELAPEHPPVPHDPPIGGWRSVHVVLR